MNQISGPHTMKPSDVIGIVLGGLLSAVGVALLNEGTDARLVGVALLLISVCLFIPGWHYQRGTIRAVGFAVLGLAAAVSVTGTVASGWFAFRCWSELQGDWLGDWLLPITAAVFVSSAFAAACAAVMVKKLRARRAHAGAAVALGIAAGLVYVLLWYWHLVPDW